MEIMNLFICTYIYIYICIYTRTWFDDLDAGLVVYFGNKNGRVKVDLPTKCSVDRFPWLINIPNTESIKTLRKLTNHALIKCFGCSSGNVPFPMTAERSSDGV